MSKISELSDGGSLLPTDYLIAVRSGGNVKVQADQTEFDRIRLGDNEKIELGNSQDLQIFHDGTDSYIDEQGTGTLNIRSSTTLRLQNAAGGNYLYGTVGGEVVLYYDGGSRLTTSSGGVDVIGSVTADGLTVDGAAVITGNITQNTGDLLYAGGGNWDIAHTIASQNLVLKTTPSGGSATQRMRISHNGDLSLYEDTGVTPKLFWDSSAESLGIGDTSPANGTLTIRGASTTGTKNGHIMLTGDSATVGEGPQIVFSESGGGSNWVGAAIGFARTGGGGIGDLLFSTRQSAGDANTTATERMRITSDKLLVGTTSTTPAFGTDTGIAFVPTGESMMSANGATALLLNRTTSDGTILDLRKDGTSIGTLGVSSGDNLFISGIAGHAGLQFSSNQIAPMVNGVDTDATVSIGVSSSRFANLYLSGQTLVSGGALSAPSYSFIGDTNTGISRPTTHTVNIVTGGQERLRVDGSGNLFVGTTSTPSATQSGFMFTSDQLYTSAGSSTTTNYQVRFYNGNGLVGAITTDGSATAYLTSSDYRLKENVVELSGATERLKQLKPSRFNFIADADKTVDGFLAHEVQDIVPEAITGAKDAMMDEEYEVTPAVLDDDGNVVTEAVMGTRSVPDYQSIDQSKLVPLLVATIQELESRIAALES